MPSMRVSFLQRGESPEGLDFYPTPPWATRALFEHVLKGRVGFAWEPACGQGHMADVVAEYSDHVFSSDVHDYGFASKWDFLSPGCMGRGPFPWGEGRPDWIITNPPFNRAADFVERSLEVAQVGVAMLCRLQFLESASRYTRIFSKRPPSLVGVFSERVAMSKGHWNPAKDRGVTAHAWFVWRFSNFNDTSVTWIPPTCKNLLTREGDVLKWARGGGESG